MELEGKVVVITGAGGGIGSALAEAFRAEGSTVVTADQPGTAADLTFDVCDATAVAAALDQVVATHGRLDVVVANAGIGVGGIVEEIDLADWDRVVDVNIKGVVHTVLPAYQRLREQGGGHVVLMASVAGLAGLPLLTPYAMSKHAVVGLGDSLRPEAARHGVGVTTVCPGPVDTPLLDTKGATPGLDVRRYLTEAAGTPISPAALAAAVIEGVHRSRPLVLPGRAKLLWRLSRWAPRATDKQIRKSMKKELESAGVA
jgi:NAD(P)-dependent dehydrogenase (short-subunit alcohol dehydrogenase family)